MHRTRYQGIAYHLNKVVQADLDARTPRMMVFDLKI